MEEILKFFLTGANGSIGKYLAKYLADQGYQITAVVHQKKWQHQNINFIEGDLFDIDNLAIDSNDYDTVIHLAASLGMYEKGQRLYRSNFLLTQKLIHYQE